MICREFSLPSVLCLFIPPQSFYHISMGNTVSYYDEPIIIINLWYFQFSSSINDTVVRIFFDKCLINLWLGSPRCWSGNKELSISSLFGSDPGNISKGSEKGKGRKSIQGVLMSNYSWATERSIPLWPLGVCIELIS